MPPYRIVHVRGSWARRGLLLLFAAAGLLHDVAHAAGAGLVDMTASAGARRLAAASWHPKNFGKKSADGAEASGSGDLDEQGGAAAAHGTPEAEEAEPNFATAAPAAAAAAAATPTREPAPFGYGITAEEVKSKPCEVIFAAFYATKPDGFKRPPGVRCNGCHESPMHITFDSAQIMHPPDKACTAIITDLETDVSGITQLEELGVQMHRLEGVVNRSSIGTPNLMYERMKAYKAFVDRAHADGYDKHIVLLDTDIVIVDNLLHLFKEPFDYGLSARGNNNNPIQGGLQLAHKDRLPQASAWLDYVLQLWRASAAKNKRGEFGFTGDQYIYAEAIGDSMGVAKRATGTKATHFAVDKGEGAKYDLLLVPSERYNRQPGGPGSDIKNKPISVLHYKGGRKEKMYVVYNPLKKGGLKAVYTLKGMT